jgi:hypothetical protein
MKMCTDHWTKLRAAIDERGLTKFISGDGAKLVEKMTTELSGGGGSETFDPLANATWAIYSNALKMAGLYLMGRDENGNPYCPICESKLGGFDENWWLDNAANEQLDKARNLGLLPPKESVQ